MVFASSAARGRYHDKEKLMGEGKRITSFFKRLFVPLMPRGARAVNTIHHPLSTGHAFPSLWLGAAAMTLTAACADLRWHKDGADTAALERDLGECQQQAHAQAVRESRSHGFSGPPIIGADARGRAVLSQPGRTDTDRFLMEHDLERICMRGRGYKLVPVEKH